ncbi:MAG: Dyp-type peroxidase [Nocardioides sp.]|jgi:dye decolorizing peroxidase
MTLPRRRFLGYVGSAVAGAAVAAPATAAVVGGSDPSPRPAPDVLPTFSPYGTTQPAIELSLPRFVEVISLDLLPGVDRPALGRLMRRWTGDVVALTDGRPAPGDTAPELAVGSAGLTVTVGLGAAAAALAGGSPAGLVDVPAMRHDRLEPRWTGGDLVLVVAAHDGTTLTHATRRLVSDAEPFARQRWRQHGFWNGQDERGQPMTGRNLFGQVDGSANPRPGTVLFDNTVWIGDGPWAGGTTLVVRRIRMDLDTWDALTRDEQERALGRRLDTGAPLTGGQELDGVNLDALDAQGRPIVTASAHVRRSHPRMNAGRRIFRKGANYTHDVDGRTEHGLLFMSHQADIADQYVPIQQALDTADALNDWTTAIGSATFALLPGFERGGWLGQSLLE